MYMLDFQLPSSAYKKLSHNCFVALFWDSLIKHSGFHTPDPTDFAMWPDVPFSNKLKATRCGQAALPGLAQWHGAHGPWEDSCITEKSK